MLGWQPDKSFEYALNEGSFTSNSHIKMMDWVADKVFQTLTQVGHLTVIIQDNDSLHTSQLTRQGLFRFYLPEYCSFDESHQLKTHEIAGRMFEAKYNLATAITSCMEARSVQGGYTLERFKFNSA